uniref:Uncharacterized protein n=2 Tax=unclassified Caudoviricetes TaxID=2788787 RepID=A0A8S5PJ14_9CAUD|nr:MAG TPA: hypothetical protein [Siphoviridae sp. ctJcm18]DAE06589.1 MAG TPA: hypothetical protein [Siphoviridae sp. ctUGQ45]
MEMVYIGNGSIKNRFTMRPEKLIGHSLPCLVLLLHRIQTLLLVMVLIRIYIQDSYRIKSYY